jgi:hypothetical protein
MCVKLTTAKILQMLYNHSKSSAGFHSTARLEGLGRYHSWLQFTCLPGQTCIAMGYADHLLGRLCEEVDSSNILLEC